MHPWVERPTLTVDIERLRQGERPDWPADAIDAAATLLREVLAPVPKKARLLAYLLAPRTRNRFGAEFRTAAKIIGADRRDVAIANLSYDLIVGALGCSTLVLPTADGPVVARNMDWWPEGPIARASYLIRCTRNGSLQFSCAGFPGAVGVVTGLSNRGFAVILNAVTTPERLRKTGYPVLLHLRRVMDDATDFADALNRLTKQKLTTAALFTLVGTRNEERVVIERTSTRHALRWARAGEPLVTTNDFRLLELQPGPADQWSLQQTSCGRYDRLCRLASSRPHASIADEQLLYWLTDPAVRQEITAQHVIIRPAAKEMRLFVPRELVEGPTSPAPAT